MGFAAKSKIFFFIFLTLILSFGAVFAENNFPRFGEVGVNLGANTGTAPIKADTDTADVKSEAESDLAARKVPANDASTGALAAGQSLTKGDVDAWLDGYMPFALESTNIAGGVVVVVKDGEVLTTRGFGYADVEAKKPFDAQTTLFRPGSVSKLFTWTAVMQLVEQGKLDLDRDVNEYLDFTIPPVDGKPLTLRNIMTHRSGFEEQIANLIVAAPNKPIPLDKILKENIPPQIFKPGTMPAYSNYATALAGYIVQRKSGLSFDEYVEKNIFARLDMRSASFRQPLPDALMARMSKGYSNASSGAKPYEIVSLAPAGSLAVSGPDIAKFMIAHLDNGGPLLKPETAKTMHDSVIHALPKLNGMALGFYEQNINGRRVLAHGGDTLWFHSYIWLFPGENTGLFVSFNSAGSQGQTGALRSELFTNFADRYFPGALPTSRVDAKTSAEHAKILAGNYVTTRRSLHSFLKVGELLDGVTITVDDKGAIQTPFLRAPGNRTRQWVEVEPWLWRDMGSHDELSAVVENGKVKLMAVGSSAPIIVFEPVSGMDSPATSRPIFYGSLIVLALLALSWPVAAIARWRFGAKLAREGGQRWMYRLLRFLAWMVFAILVGWLLAISALSDGSALDGSKDNMLRLLQITGFIAFVGFPLAALADVIMGVRAKRGWFSLLMGGIILLAGIGLLWVAFTFNLIGFNLAY